ncbi:unnamed protein product [Urochloa decumbens]|uniref:Probable purine permease n=1 Tax=Urochloa decumbens TaxID=240449 RepID=A0ABC9F5U3_9POAL
MSSSGDRGAAIETAGVVGDGLRQRRVRPRRAERGHAPRQDLLRPGRQEPVDANGGAVLRHAARHPAANLLPDPAAVLLLLRGPAAARQARRHLRRPGRPHRRRQPDVLVRPHVPAHVDLRHHLREPGLVQRPLLLLPQQGEVPCAHPQLRRAAHLLGGARRRQPRLRRQRQRHPKGKFPAGFALTLSASALFSLILSLMQLTFEEVLRSDALPTVLEMQFWSNTAAAVVSVAGLFASGEWHTIAGESAAYGKGEVAYAMTLAWTAVSWQLCTMGLMGLVAMVSSLFTNVISTVGTPLAPVIAVIFLGDRLDGVKLLAMLLAVWGLMSYVYQHYLDDRAKAKMIAEKSDEQAVQDAKISAE